MQAQIRTQLRALIKDWGPRIADDPSRLTGLLLDHSLGRGRPEIDALVLAVKAGVVNQILAVLGPRDLNGALSDAHTAVLRLLPHDPRRAKWAVDTWAYALRKVEERDLTIHFKCIHCHHAADLDRSLAVSPLECPRCGRAQTAASGAASAPAPAAKSAKSTAPSPASPPPAVPSPTLTPAPSPQQPRPVPPKKKTSPPPPSPQRPPPRPPQSSGVGKKLAAALVAGVGVVIVLVKMGSSDSPVASPVAPAPRMSTPAPAPPPAVPAPAPVVAQWTIAAVRARAYSAKVGGKQVAQLERGQGVDVLELTDTFVRVRVPTGAELWIDPIVAIPRAEVARVSAQSCAQYSEQSQASFDTRWSELTRLLNQGTRPLLEMFQRIRQRDERLDEWLGQADLSGARSMRVDAAAATWHKWSARYAESMAKVATDAATRDPLLRETAICSEASAHADVLDADSYYRWSYAASRLGQPLPVQAFAAPYLAPKDSNAWAVLMLAIAADPKGANQVELMTGSALQLLKMSRNRGKSLEFLEEIKSRTTNPALVSAINQAVQVPSGMPPGPAPRPAPVPGDQRAPVSSVQDRLLRFATDGQTTAGARAMCVARLDDPRQAETSAIRSIAVR